ASAWWQHESLNVLTQAPQMLGDRAGAPRSAAPPPLVADEPVGSDEAGRVGRESRLSGNAQHFKPNQVVGEGEAPQFLSYTLGFLAADVLAPLQHLRFHLVVAELDLPALVIERRHLLGRILLRIEERREQSLWLE